MAPPRPSDDALLATLLASYSAPTLEALPTPWAPLSLSMLRFNAAALNASLLCIPEARDEQPTRVYTPKHPIHGPPADYPFPVEPLRSLENAAMFEKALDVDTLFFSFYYQQASGTRAPLSPLSVLHLPLVLSNPPPCSPPPSPPPLQNTHAQFLAAKALKARNWRYNKHYNTRFLRRGEPLEVNAESEKGAYHIFDYETTWSVRERKDFRFLYQHLE